MQDVKTEEVVFLPVDKISEPEHEVRQVIILEGLEELAGSIKAKGIIQPITVTVKGDGWEIIAGHRRYLAGKMAGLESVPCLVREETEEEALKTKLHENYFREDINVVDEALFFKALYEKSSMDCAEIARAAGKSESYVHSRLFLLAGSPAVVGALQAGQIKVSQAIEINKAKDEAVSVKLLEVAVNQGANVRSLRVIRGDFESQLPPVVAGSEGSPPPPAEYTERKYLFQCPCCEKGFPTSEIYPLSVCRACHDGFMETLNNEKGREAKK